MNYCKQFGKIFGKVFFLFCVFSFFSCDNFLTDNAGFKKLLEEEVAFNTAEIIPILVAPRGSTHGTVLNPPTEARIGFPFQVKFQLNESYGEFTEWKVYAGGLDNGNLIDKKDFVIENKEQTGNQFAADITIKKKYEKIQVVPECKQNEYDAAEEISITVAVPNQTMGVLVSPPTMCKVGFTIDLEFQLNEDYGTFHGWKIYSNYVEDGENTELDETYVKIVSQSNYNNSYKCTLMFLKYAENVRIIPDCRKNPYDLAESVMFEVRPDNNSHGSMVNPPEKGKVGFAISLEFNLNEEFGTFGGWEAWADYGKPEQKNLVETGIVSFLDISENKGVCKCQVKFNNSVENASIRIIPRVISHPVIKFEYPSVKENSKTKEVGSITPVGNTKEIVGKEFDLKVKMDEEYAFLKWHIDYEKSDGTKVNLVSETDAEDSSVLNYKDGTEIIFALSNMVEKDSLEEANCTAKILKNNPDKKYVITAKAAERPKIKLTDPSNGSSGNNRITNIKIVFSKSMASEITDPEYYTVTAEDSNGKPYSTVSVTNNFISPQISNGGTVIKINGKTDSLLQGNAYVYVTVSGAVYYETDGKKIPLGKDYVFHYKTGKSADDKLDYLGVDFWDNTETEFELINNINNDKEKISKKRFTGNLKSVSEVRNLTAENQEMKTAFRCKVTADDSSGLKSIILREKLIFDNNGNRLYDNDGKWLGEGGYAEKDCISEYEYDLTTGLELPINIGYESDEENGIFGFDFGIAIDGLHQFAVVVQDKYNNESEAKIIYAIRDTTPPDIELIKEKIKNINAEYSKDDNFTNKYVKRNNVHYYKNQPVISFEISEKITDVGENMITSTTLPDLASQTVK